MHVLLLNPPDDLDDMLGVGKDFVQKYEPLGLLYLAAVVREAGARVTVVDAHAEGLDREAVQRRIADARADIVGFSTLTCSGAAVYYLGRWLFASHLVAATGFTAAGFVNGFQIFFALAPSLLGWWAYRVWRKKAV